MSLRLLLNTLTGLSGLLLASGCMRADSEAPPSGLAQRALSHPAFQWDSLTTPDFTTYVDRPTASAATTRDLHDRVGDGLQHALHILGEKSYPLHLRVFQISSRERVGLLTGTASTGLGDPSAHAVIVVENAQWRGFVRHEIMHVVSLGLWGEPGGHVGSNLDQWRSGGWLREGIAAMAEDRCAEYSNRGVAAAMASEGTLIPLEVLRRAFYEQDDFAAYLQAGALVEFLLAEGQERFRHLWRDGSLEETYGKSAAEIQEEWVWWLHATPRAARPPSVEELRSRGCG